MRRLGAWRTASMLLALAASRTAFAETTTGGESSSGADTSSSDTTDGACETCPPSTSTGAIDFGDLEHGNPPAGERIIEVSASTKCTCSECACFDDTATQIRLALDGDGVGEPCPSAQCEFTVVLTPGEHVLSATATYTSGDVMAEAPLVVPGEAGTTDTGTPMQDEGSSACGCATPGRASPLGLLVLVTLAVRRRTANRRRREILLPRLRLAAGCIATQVRKTLAGRSQSSSRT